MFAALQLGNGKRAGTILPTRDAWMDLLDFHAPCRLPLSVLYKICDYVHSDWVLLDAVGGDRAAAANDPKQHRHHRRRIREAEEEPLPSAVHEGCVFRSLRREWSHFMSRKVFSRGRWSIRMRVNRMKTKIVARNPYSALWFGLVDADTARGYNRYVWRSKGVVQIFHPIEPHVICEPWRTGDVLEMDLDLDRERVRFLHNREEVGGSRFAAMPLRIVLGMRYEGDEVDLTVREIRHVD